MELRLQNLGFSFGQAKILKNLNCRFSEGKFYALLGPNGSGKTTLLDLISGFLPPQQGQVLLGEKPVTSFSKKKLARMISLVSQNYLINFPFHVEEVVMMGRHPYINRFSRPSMSDEALADSVMAVSGISHLRGRPVTRLSGGEKQRCIFARALCQDTPILLLDEAFSNMDIHHTYHLLSLVKNAVKDQRKTVIAVLHDINLAAAFSDEILFLKEGEIVDMGHTPKVLTCDNIETVFNVESRVEFNDYVQAKQVYFKPV